MRWKSLNLYFAIAVIRFSNGNNELTIETNLIPENVVTTTAEMVTKNILTTEEPLVIETSTDKPITTNQENNNDSNSNENEPVHTTDEQDSNEIPGDNTTEGDPATTKVTGSQEQEPGSNNSSELMNLTDQIVVTENGPVVGHYLDDTKQIRSYIDIPYGAISGLFAAPVKSTPWEEIHQVSDHEKRCPQIEHSDAYVGDLDCLTLSIFAPSNVMNAPVLFHIHEGQFQSGSGDPTIYGPDYLVNKGIILVLPNYRLGPLGFLCLQNEVVPGNAGLKDLAMALEWTANNIAVFGGDASKITVSGDGTAGALAGLLALSPMSKGYINKVITESGSLFASWALDRNPLITAASLAESIRKNITGDIDLRTLITSAKDFVLRPCVERGNKTFMNETPWKMINDAEQIDITFMIGSANYAGMHEALQHNAETLTSLTKDFSQILPEDLKFTDEVEKAKISKKVKKQYFKKRNITTDDMENLSLYYTDAFYLGPSIRYARSLAKSGAKVFLYEFSYVGELNRELEYLETSIQGAARGDIIGYVFTQDGEVAPENSEDETVVDLITDLWVSFLHNGHPSADNVQWNKLEPVAESEEECLIIDLEPKVQKKGLHVDRLSTWSEIYRTHYIEIETSLAAELKPLSSFLLVLTWFLTKTIV